MRGFSRFQSLATLMHFESRLVTDVNQILTDPKLLEPIDYAVVDATIRSERSRCYAWLQEVLNQPKKSVTELKAENIMGIKSKLSTCNTGIEAKTHSDKKHFSRSNYVEFTSHGVCWLWCMCQYLSSKGVGTEAG